MQCGWNSTCFSSLFDTAPDASVTVNTNKVSQSPQLFNVTNAIRLSSSEDLNLTVLPKLKINATVEDVLPVIGQLELNLILSSAIVTTALNIVVLVASKFASGGKSPTLVFVRSLCAGDSLVGCYGIIKATMYLYIDQLLVNFFLPESLFFTASFASGLSLLALNFDSLMKLTEPLNSGTFMDKKNIITVMVMLWNVSFIAGFLPQVGWRSSPDAFHIVRFFYFFPWHFLFFFATFLIIIFILNVIVVIYIWKRISNIQLRNHFLSPESLTFNKYRTLVVTALIDMLLWLLCYLPYFVYLSLHCETCLFHGRTSGEKNLVYFLPVFLTKSFISAIVHGYRTAQIYAVVKNFSRKFTKIVQNSLKKRPPTDPTISNERESVNVSTLLETVSNRIDEVEAATSQLTLCSSISVEIHEPPREITKL